MARKKYGVFDEFGEIITVHNSKKSADNDAKKINSMKGYENTKVRVRPVKIFLSKKSKLRKVM